MTNILCLSLSCRCRRCRCCLGLWRGGRSCGRVLFRGGRRFANRRIVAVIIAASLGIASVLRPRCLVSIPGSLGWVDLRHGLAGRGYVARLIGNGNRGGGWRSTGVVSGSTIVRSRRIVAGIRIGIRKGIGTASVMIVAVTVVGAPAPNPVVRIPIRWRIGSR
jgi:hypothetical protein